LRRHDRIVAIEGDRQSVLRRHGGDALDEVLLPGGAAVTAAFKVDLPCGAVDLGYLRTDYRGQIAVGVERALDPNALAELADVPVLLALAPGAIMGGVLVWLALSDVSVVPGPGGITLSDPGAYGPSPDEPPIVPASPLTTGLIGALALLAGLGSLGFALWLGLAGRLLPRPGAAEDQPARLVQAVEESLDDLRREPDARAAILRIYRHFERALAGAAVPRRPWQTPTEFMRAALSRLPLPPSPVRSLTGLFEIARFSRHPVGEAERDSAWRSLTEIRATLDTPTEPHDDARSVIGAGRGP
jgi:hypothetical protein